MDWDIVFTIVLPILILLHKQYYNGRVNYRECNITLALIINTCYHGVLFTVIIHGITLLILNYKKIYMGVNILVFLYNKLRDMKHDFTERRNGLYPH